MCIRDRAQGARFLLRNVATGDTFVSTWNPLEFIVPDGDYVAAVVEAPWKTTGEFAAGSLPHRVTAGAFTVLDWYLLETASMTPFSCSVAAQAPGARSTFSNLHHAGDSMSVSVHTQYWAHDWWGRFVLPESLTAGPFYARGDSGTNCLLYTSDAADE